MNPIPVYNVNSTANEAGMIVKIADMILCYDSCHMMLDEQDKFIQQVMAYRNAAMAAAAELTTLTGTSEGMWVEREVNNLDFVRSSRWIA
jgi:uncharacterized protein YfaA (DUF2138 family)